MSNPGQITWTSESETFRSFQTADWAYEGSVEVGLDTIGERPDPGCEVSIYNRQGALVADRYLVLGTLEDGVAWVRRYVEARYADR